MVKSAPPWLCVWFSRVEVVSKGTEIWLSEEEEMMLSAWMFVLPLRSK